METDVNGISLFFEQRGGGQPIVLVHGYPLDHTIWEAMVLEMKSPARVILPDLRGFGRSGLDGEISTMRQMADDLAALLDRLQIQKTVLVGHSMGGYVTLAFAAAYPDRLSGIGFVSSQAAADSAERRAGRYAQAEEILAHGTRILAETMTPKLAADQQFHADIYRVILRSQPKGLAAALKGMAERADTNGTLPTIGVPGVVITGLDDQLIPVERSRELSAGMSRAELVEIAGAGHMPMMEQPSLTAAALDKLLLEVQG